VDCPKPVELPNKPPEGLADEPKRPPLPPLVPKPVLVVVPKPVVDLLPKS